MTDRSRMAGISGIAFVVALALQFVVVPAPPDFDAPAGEIRDYLVDNRTGSLTAGLLQLLAVVFFMVFLVGLRDVIRRADDGAMLSTLTLIGGVLMAGSVLIAQATLNSTLWVDGYTQTAGDDAIRLTWSLAYLMFGAAAPAMVLLFGSTAIAALRNKVLPAVAGWVAGLATVVALGGFLMQLGSDFGAFGLVTFVALMLSAAVTSVAMVMGKASAAT